MKIQINILLLLLAVFTLTTSCEGDLDVTPNDPELLLEDEFFADSNSYTSLQRLFQVSLTVVMAVTGIRNGRHRYTGNGGYGYP